MMTQSHRGKGAWIRLAATLPVIAVVFFAFGCGARSPQEAQAKAETDLADTTAIHLQMPCNPIGIMDRYESRPRHSVFSRRHTGIDFVLEEGDPIWAAADGHLVSIESGDETIVTYDKTTGISTFHYPENIFMPAETSLQPGKFNVGDVEVNVTGRDGMQEFRCGPESAGLTVTIMHEEGIRTVYKQVPYIILRPDRIKTGQMIGKAGKTAESTDVHLHFEVHKDGKPVDPAPYISTPLKISKAVFIDISKAGVNENRLSDSYDIALNGERTDKDKIGEAVAREMAKDSTIRTIQISADPQTPMGIIEDIKEQLKQADLFYVLNGIVNTPPPAAESDTDGAGRILYQYKRNNIIIVRTNAADRYLIGPYPGYLDEESAERVRKYLLNEEKNPDYSDIIEQEFTLPDGTKVTYPVSQGIIVMQNDRGTSFKGYQEVNEFIRNIYIGLQEDAAMKIFGRSYADLSYAEMEIIRKAVPMRVVENQPKSSKIDKK